MKNKVIAIVGPTAVGKTKLSIEIAKHYNGEIISGDSMQIYKGMDIGTAKVTSDEMQRIPHYMIDLKHPDESFSVADFKQYVTHYIETISAKYKLPILVGGSGLYVQAALYNYNFSTYQRNNKVVAKLNKEIETNGIEPLYKRLQALDPQQAKKIHPNNHRRVVRALEIYETTGKRMSDYQQQQNKQSPYHLKIIGLQMNRTELYERINQRVDMMVDEGLVEEVYELYKCGYANKQSMQAIGYKEFIPYFTGEISLNEAIATLKQNSRRYAKRQYTWFRNKMDVTWYDVSSGTIDEKLRKILADLAGFIQS
ncbi:MULTISPECIES: tRNA (adenosine(37)-N6)-dimethylallyltransferase MiaA [Clostridia]|uniref:tRNA (adenosine(37)-N6)-dimethylallyltransferase MiaA n=1 Tax=Clostridia TaxID=186801 RepID=UPI000EA3CD53|nr:MULTISPECIES: tRNA (adenosine(37)-N6)-dimethylallyltransferase MiaA [Clostridia]NBJ68311.1 tRNA (adenosine(37)-N6)-dimethylallyltransferase MiaA [Roseburia sp. 1XD42-34]RKI81402.1 tRNA (adenosine(37)-N6)-dimethylallyltransferase MiaA [Clostridium sp. 1xD42-85]